MQINFYGEYMLVNHIEDEKEYEFNQNNYYGGHLGCVTVNCDCDCKSCKRFIIMSRE